MATYYLDPAAAGSGDGTTTGLTGAHCAFKTWAEAYAGAPTISDTLCVKRGTVLREQAKIPWYGTSSTPFTITDYSTGNLPAICGADLVGTWSVHDGNIYSATCETEPHIVIFDGTVGTNKATHDDCTANGDWNWTSDVLYCFCDAGDPDTVYTDPGIEAGTTRWCFYTDYVTRNYISISNFRVYGFDGSPGIHIYRSNGWTLNTVTIDKCARTGIHNQESSGLTVANSTLTGVRTLASSWRGIYNYSSDPTYPVSNITIHDTDVTNWTGYAIDVAGYSYSYPSYNLSVYNCDLSHSPTGLYIGHVDGISAHDITMDDNLSGTNCPDQEEYGLATSEVQNADFYNLTITNGRTGYEMWSQVGNPSYPLHGASHNIKFHHSKIDTMTEHGILNHTGDAHGVEIYRNWILNCYLGGITGNDADAASTDFTIRHNSLYNNNTGDSGYTDIYFGSTNAGYTIINNAVFAVTTYAFRSGNNATQCTHRHNCWWRASGNIIDDHGTTYTAATGATWETDGAVFDNPDFINTGAGTEDLGLQSSSPCIDVGEDVGDDSDYYGNPIV